MYVVWVNVSVCVCVCECAVCIGGVCIVCDVCGVYMQCMYGRCVVCLWICVMCVCELWWVYVVCVCVYESMWGIYVLCVCGVCEFVVHVHLSV